MDKVFKRLVCTILILSLLLQPALHVQASQIVNEQVGAQTYETEVITQINPLYKDVISERDLNPLEEDAPVFFAEPVYEADLTVLGSQLREAMRERLETVTIYALLEESLKSSTYFSEILELLKEEALAETDNPAEGDYLRWQYGGYKAGAKYSDTEEGCRAKITLTMTYYTSAEQEADVDEKLETVLWDELDLDDETLSDYEKTERIYDYICDNVVYYNDNLEDESYKLKYSAYAALMNGASVCQGYATLLYRMLEEAGIDARVVAGDANGAHGWNISRLGNKYYYSDATWDAKKEEYKYFLKGSEEFEQDHTPYLGNPYYDDAPVYEEPYKSLLSVMDYVSEEQVHTLKKTDAVNATCSKDGNVEYYRCSGCGNLYTDEAGSAAITEEETIVKATGHKWDNGTVTKPATCTALGVKTFHCTQDGCNETKILDVNKLAHVYKNVVTKATTKADGKTVPTCTKCGYKDTKKATTISRPYKMTLSATKYTYTGKVIKPKVTVKDKKGKVISSKYYKVTYSSGCKNVGKYSVKVTFKGNYSGSMTASFVINPKGTSISSLTKASKAFTVKWKKQSTQVTGYQIQYTTDKKFKKSVKTTTVSSYKTTSKKISKLSSRKTYYVRIRTYKKVGSTKYYSGWSTVKSVKTK